MSAAAAIDPHAAARALLDWWALAGVEADAPPVSRPQARPAPTAPARPRVAADPAAAPPRPAEAAAEAERLSAACADLAQLRAAIEGFEGCGLKRGARSTVFCDGVEGAPVMLIGEAPGKEEDDAGKPFVGRSGQLLDRMLASIGLDRRTNLYIANIIPWRPPGNRTPTADEIAVCLPFIRRHVALARPRFVILAGGVSAQAMLGTGEGIMKLRNRPHALRAAPEGEVIPARCLLHPAYVLRRPQDKALVWRDLLTMSDEMSAAGIALSVTGTP